MLDNSPFRKWTKEEAIEFARSEKWKDMTYEERAVLQLFQKRLCIPFDVFHEAITKALGRPVYTHEFGLNWEGLMAELLGTKEAPTLEEIIEMIPEEKRFIIGGGSQERQE